MAKLGIIPQELQQKDGPLENDAVKAGVKAKFLEVLGQTNIRQAAIQACGVTPKTIYDWIHKGYISEDDLHEALLAYHDRLRGEIAKRAYVGTKKLALSNGRIVRDEQGEPVYQMIPDNNLLWKIAEHILPEYQGAKKLEITNMTPSGVPEQFLIAIDSRDLLPSEMQTLKQVAEAIQARKNKAVVIVESGS